jgi:hypothetical protein
MSDAKEGLKNENKINKMGCKRYTSTLFSIQNFWSNVSSENK